MSAHNFAGGKERDKLKQKLDSLSEERQNRFLDLANKYGIQDLSAHARLAALIDYQSKWGPEITLTTENWSIPKSAPTWKSTQHLLQEAFSLAFELDNRLEMILNNQTAVEALRFFHGHQAFESTFAQLSDFKYHLHSAKSLSARRGNRPLDTWKYAAADECRKFWTHHMKEEAKAYFDSTKTKKRTNSSITEPSNTFTKWFCEFMKLVGGIGSSECRTILTQTNGDE